MMINLSAPTISPCSLYCSSHVRISIFLLPPLFRISAFSLFFNYLCVLSHIPLHPSYSLYLLTYRHIPHMFIMYSSSLPLPSAPCTLMNTSLRSVCTKYLFESVYHSLLLQFVVFLLRPCVSVIAIYARRCKSLKRSAISTILLPIA